MDCGIAREALSAAMDGEAVPGLAMTDVDRHVQGCGPCARWQDRAARINRLAALSPAGEERDLADAVLGKVTLPAGEPSPVSAAALSHHAEPAPRPAVPFILVRIGLVLAAVAQAAVAIVELLGQDDPMMTMAGHMDHETSAFNFAIGVVLAFVAADPRRARAQLPLLGSVVGVLVLVSTFDLGAHAVGWSRLVTHIPLAVGLILVAALGTNADSGTNPGRGTTGTATDMRTRRFPMRTAKRLGVLGSIVVGGLLAVTGSAYAHVTAQPSTATQGSYTKIAFRVPNEEDKASTVKLEVTFPTDHPIASVEVKDVPGWTAQIDKSTLAKPLQSDDGPITEAVSKITWSGGSLGPDHFAEFEVSMGPLPTDTDKLVFKAVQTYDNGDVVRWIDTSAPGGAEPEHPAPTVQLTAKNADTAAAVTPAAATSSTSDSSLPLVFGIAGIVIGLAAGGLAVAALRRGRAAE